MILSAGDFVVYRTESNAISLLEPRFGNLGVRRNKERLMDAWLNSKLFWVSGLDGNAIREKVLAECRNGGDFLRIIMSEMARQQGVRRWADCTPEHLLYLPRIKQTLPDALIIHIIRDGRDVALSIDRLGYIKRAPWDKKPSVMAAGLYWDWIVRRGRKDGCKLGNDYIEVRFEDLLSQPRQVLATLSEFIEHDLDYDRILRVGVGSVSEPNTSFKDTSGNFNPIGRWKQGYSSENLITFEALVGKTLEELGYPLATTNRQQLERANLKTMRAAYQAYFDIKLYLKSKTPLGQLLMKRDLSWL
jgi:Sulfotransferase family